MEKLRHKKSFVDVAGASVEFLAGFELLDCNTLRTKGMNGRLINDQFLTLKKLLKILVNYLHLRFFVITSRILVIQIIEGESGQSKNIIFLVVIISRVINRLGGRQVFVRNLL